MSAPAPAELDAPSEASSRERRAVMLAIAGINLLFLAVDLAVYGPGNLLVWGGRVGVSAALLGLWRTAGRERRPDRQRVHLAAWLVACASTFALIAVGSGGLAGPYLAFYPLLPMVAAIMVPDEPVGLLLAGAVTLGVTTQQTWPLPPGPRAFWAVAAGSALFYAVMGAVLYRRMRRRERAAATARVAALAELARSEHQRAQADRLASIGRLASGVAHEINNPLAFVSTNLAYVEEELRERQPGETGLLEALAESRGGVERIKRIVQDLRGFARGTSATGPTDVAGALDEALRLASWRLGPVARVERRVAPGLPHVLASRAELVQVLVNLLVNAADAVEEARRGLGTVEVTAGPAERAVRLAVEDDGVGLAEGVARQLFEPFFTTKGARGTGLGLAISREFTERWGGTLVAENRPGGGARFLLTIPAARAEALAPALTPAPTSGPATGPAGPTAAA